jgi:hypothetical protein
MATEVTVVIGNHQGERVLPDCLASLRLQSQEPIEVIVVDGGSSDGSVEVAESNGARVLRHENRGVGFLYNRGTEAATAPYVLLLNNDVALEPDCLERLAAALDADPLRFAADARQLAWDGQSLVHARTTIRRGPLLHELLPGFRLDLRTAANTIVPTVCANGGAMIVRGRRLLELGGFDETFFLDFEDLDLGWRAWLRGWPSAHVPDAIVRHRVGAVTTADVQTKRLISSHHNLMRFALKCLPASDAARIILTEFLRIPVHPRLIPPALASVTRELPEILAERHRIRPAREHLDWLVADLPVDEAADS